MLINPFLAPVFGLPKLTFLILVALALAAAWCISVIKKGSFSLSRSWLGPALGAFFILAVLSTLQSIHTPTSLFGQYGRWEGLVTIACYFVLYLAAHNIWARKRSADFTRTFFLALLASSVLVSATAIIEFFWTNPFLLLAKVYCAAGFGQPNSYEAGRSMATFGNPVFLAAYLALAVPVIFSGLLYQKYSLIPRWLLYPALLITSVALLLTFGRAALIGTVAGVMLISWLSWDYIKKFRTRIIQVILIALIFLIAFGFVQAVGHNYTIVDRVTSIFKLQGSTLARVQMWITLLPLISERPLLGSGPDTFKYVFGKYKPEGWVEHIYNPLIDKAHSDSLQIAVTHGLLGLAAYLWIFILFIWLGVKRVRASGDRRESWFAIGVLGAALAYMIQLQFNFSHFTASPLFWLLLGSGSGLLMSRPVKVISLEIPRAKKVVLFAGIAVVFLTLTALSTTPLAADIYFYKGRSLQAIKKYPEAIQEYERAVSLNGLEVTYMLALADARMQLGQQAKNTRYINLALAGFDRARNINPVDEQIYFKAGDAFLNAGRDGGASLMRKSIDWNNQGLILNPVMVDAYLDNGVAYAYLGDYDDAIDAWLDALKIEPGNDRAYFNLGWVYEQKGRPDLAKKNYLKAYRLNPRLHEARAAFDRL